MATRNYWINVFTWETWQEFIAAGANVTGFSEARKTVASKLKIGDQLICYLKGANGFLGLLEVTSKAFYDSTPLWTKALFPHRVNVKLLVRLEPETSVDIHSLGDSLGLYQKGPTSWTGYVQASPTAITVSDGEAIADALKFAQANPVRRGVDRKRIDPSPRKYRSRIENDVVIPEPDPVETSVPIITQKEARDHTEIQFMLLQLGKAANYDVWVASNDRNRIYKGKPIAEHFPLIGKLPVQFDEKINRIIELIDVLWLKGTSIEHAFEIESTTSIYSGLLRMSDLVSTVPNLNIRLYIVAPDARRDKVIQEVNRPTFREMKRPLVRVCQYISFSRIREVVPLAEQFSGVLTGDVLSKLAESCERDLS